MKCIHCQKQHAHYETYCSVTGKLIDDSLVRKYTYETLDFCISCGDANKEGSLHCSKCGTEMVKASSKKNSVNKLIDQGLTAIPDIKNSVNFNKSKTSVKEASVEHKNYIKKTPLILLPAAISIAIIMLISAIIINKFKDNIGSISEFLELDGMNALDADLISAYLSYELGIQVNIPDFPLFTMLISLMHNINYSFVLDVTESGSKEVFKFEESNALLGLVLIPVIALIIGALVYGWMARKYNWHFWRGIIYSTILYTLFLTIVSFFARFKADASGTGYYDGLVRVKVELLPSIFDSIITGVVLTAVTFVFFGYISYSGKQILTKLESDRVYFKYAMYALAATAVGFVLHFINAAVALKSSADELASDVYSGLFLAAVPESMYYITAVYAAVVNWYLSLFGKVNANGRSEYDNDSIEYTWFFKNSLYETETNEIIEITTFINPFIFVIIIFAILGGIGFLLTKNQLLDLKEVAIIAGIFTVIQLVMLYFINVNIEYIDSSDKMITSIGLAWFRQLITTATFAFAAIIAGSYVRMKFFFGK